MRLWTESRFLDFRSKIRKTKPTNMRGYDGTMARAKSKTLKKGKRKNQRKKEDRKRNGVVDSPA